MDGHTPRAADGRLVSTKWGAGAQRFAGPWGLAVSRNLRPDASGLKDWSDAEIARAIRDGVCRDGTTLKPPMGCGFYKTMSEAASGREGRAELFAHPGQQRQAAQPGRGVVEGAGDDQLVGLRQLE